MALLELQDLILNRGRQPVLHVPQLTIEEGEVLAVIGPNGAGKSTLLLALANLLPPAGGLLRFRGRPLLKKDDLDYRRQIGLVMQDPMLLDGSVAYNVETGLRFRKLPAAERERRAAFWMARLGITALAARPAGKISGGEAQRASLARALALQPALLLLDEPFSALDAPTRSALLDDVHTIFSEQRQTAVFVTHDMQEALALGSRVAVLLNGGLCQVGKPTEVFNMPASTEVAAFVGIETILPGRVLAVEDGLARIQVNGCTFEAVGEVKPGQAVYMCLRPEDFTLHPSDGTALSSARNRLKGQITRLAPQGPLVRVSVDCGFPVVALITLHSSREMGLQTGQTVNLSFKASAAHLVAH
ncbi:MAG TPA: ABC transporter ATP-binding protein [Anaerolineaceae bacterium]|nr:ABC transporter ATP-binding protein [Anaerolineaceae bacterium]HPN52794.1 ABC transporter ATP-binding protein [Anaerolineaceae bacterium]